MVNIVVLSGAGMSEESGLKTFRDSGGLWEGYDVMEVASPEGWSNNTPLVLQFYNERRRQLLTTEPNAGHKALAEFEKLNKITIITQNIDDLHERAGSSNIIHLHGELFKVRSTYDSNLIYEWKKDLLIGDNCENGYQLRPYIVWFGEEVPLITKASNICETADYLIIVGTSLQVYPAAGLLHYAPPHCKIYYIDPKANEISVQLNKSDRLELIPEKASTGIIKVLDKIKTLSFQ